MPFKDPILGGDFLVRPQMESPNFVTGVSGWIIRKDGSVEFNNGTFRGQLVVGTSPGSHIQVGGATDAILIYDSGNNLIASIAPASGTDSNGNHFLQGMTSYNLSAPAKFSQIVGGRLVFGQIIAGVPDLTDAGAIVCNATNVMTQILAMSTSAGATTNPPNFQMFAGDINQTTGTTGAPQVFLTDVAGNSATDMYISGSAIKTDNAGNAATWTTPTMGTGWTNGSGVGGNYHNLRFRLDAENNMHVTGVFHANTTTPTTTIATGFTPITTATVQVGGGAVSINAPNRVFPWYLNSSGNMMGITAAMGTFAANDTFMVNAKVPIGNLT